METIGTYNQVENDLNTAIELISALREQINLLEENLTKADRYCEAADKTLELADDMMDFILDGTGSKSAAETYKAIRYD